MDQDTQNNATAKKILVVADNEDARKRYLAKLVKEDFLTEEAADSDKGVEAAFREHPDLILLDVKMPKLDGMSMIKDLRRDAWGRTVPVILVSDFDPDGKIAREILDEEPAFLLLKRNYSLDDVMDKIRDVLKLKSRLRGGDF